MEEKIYTCKCGRTFTKPNSFNAHKSHCIEILGEEKYKSRLEQSLKSAKRALEIQAENIAIKNQTTLDLWLSEQHTCERCGKIMTEKFGSGRFCSTHCAHSRIHTNEEKQKISNSLIGRLVRTPSDSSHTSNVKYEYERNPNYCKICGKLLPYNLRHRKTCGRECYLILNKENTIKAGLANAQNSNPRYAYAGYYQGIFFASSWELIYYLYQSNHGVSIKRNDSYFEYEFNGSVKTYLPDFYLVDENKYIEIKSKNQYWYDESKTQAKIDSMLKNNFNYEIIWDIRPYQKWVEEEYNLKGTKSICEYFYTNWIYDEARHQALIK